MEQNQRTENLLLGTYILILLPLFPIPTFGPLEKNPTADINPFPQ